MNRTGRRGIGRAWVAGIAVMALLAAACSPTIPGQLETPGDIAGLPVTHFESGLKADAPEPEVHVRHASESTEDRLAIAAIADVTDYWTEQFPAHFQQEFRPVSNLLSFDGRSDEFEVCRSTTAEVIGNAFYCPLDDSVGWDRGLLLPLLRDRFGVMSVVTVLGHEFGHAVQYRLGDKAGIDDNTPTIVREQQADCFTGAYFRWIAEDRSAYFQLSTAGGLNQVLASLFFIRDDPGQSADAPDAHGMAFDRTYAFQLGFEQGPAECAAIDQAEVASRITEQRFDQQDPHRGDAPINEHMIGLLKLSLDEAFSGTGVEPPAIVNAGGVCPDGPQTRPASYCPDTNIVSIDQAALAELGQPIDRNAERAGTESSGGLGDFAAFAEIVSRYTQGIQYGVGLPVDNENAGLRTACLVGAWAKVASAEGGPVQLSPGDLDEAIAELLQPGSLIAADLNGHRVANGFAKVEALRQGYFEGSESCSQVYP